MYFCSNGYSALTYIIGSSYICKFQIFNFLKRKMEVLTSRRREYNHRYYLKHHEEIKAKATERFANKYSVAPDSRQERAILASQCTAYKKKPSTMRAIRIYCILHQVKPEEITESVGAVIASVNAFIESIK